EFESLVPIHSGKKLRIRWAESEIEAGEFRPLSRSRKEALSISPQVVDIFARKILDEEVDSARLSDPRDRRRQKCEHLRFRQPCELPIHCGDHRGGLQSRRHSIVIRCQVAEIGSAASTRGLGKHTVPRDSLSKE